MLIVAGNLRTAPENRDRVVEIAATVMNATREEDGCYEYVFTADSQEPDLIRLYELWESGEHLSAHLKTSHLAEWRQAAGDLIVESEIKIFTISETRDL